MSWKGDDAMLLLISPAKTMKQQHLHLAKYPPAFMTKTKAIVTEIRQKKVEELEHILHVRTPLAKKTYEAYQKLLLDTHGYAALDAYDGVAFQAMHLQDITIKGWDYLCEHLRILSALYGIVEPISSVYPYRLEMHSPLAVNGAKQLYDFWGDDIARIALHTCKDHKEPYLINLASKEYDRVIRPYVPHDTLIDIAFYQCAQGKRTQHSTQVKKARGQMVRFMADHMMEHMDEIKGFCVDGYQFDEQNSTRNTLVFVKTAGRT